MTVEEIAEALRKLVEEGNVSLATVPQVLESYGHLAGEEDRLNRCRAVTAMIRQILRDEQVAELLDLTLKVHALRSVQGLFDIRTGPMLSESYWKEFDAKLRESDQRVVQLRRAANRKLILLSFLTAKLAELKCEGTFVLPRLSDDLFPALAFPS